MSEFFNWVSGGSTSALVFITIFAVLVIGSLLIYVVAFFQGREISFWPPRIGEKVTRKKTSSVDGTSIITKDDVLLKAFPPDFKSNISKAREVQIIGVDLHNTIMLNYAAFTEILNKGGVIKILMVDPESSACEHAVSLHMEPLTLADEQNAIYKGLKLCARLRRETNGNLEIRTINHVPGFGSVALDSYSPNGIMYLKYYSFKGKDGPKPMIVVNSQEGYWFEFFRNEAAEMWKNATAWSESPLKDENHKIVS